MIRVSKVADVINQSVVLTSQSGYKVGDVMALLTNASSANDPIAQNGWTADLVIGEGPGARKVVIELAQFFERTDSFDQPKLIYAADLAIFYFENMLFISERAPLNAREFEEIVLRIKRIYYQQREELVALRAAVSNYESALSYRASNTRRDPIPDDVKMVVWARDGGACVRCGIRRDLHFDHIIPVSKGGGNSELNIQLLCQTCNLKKSDKIAF